MRNRTPVRIAVALALIAFGFLGGALMSGGGGDGQVQRVDNAGGATPAQAWTCSMHPQIQLPGPGQCPLCGMDLIPVEAGAQDEGDGVALTMSDAAMGLAEIRTTPVRRGEARRQVRLVGKVEYDETRVKSIAAWVSGRLDRLFVDYEGIRIRRGDHLALMYSPELVSAQEELLQAKQAQEELRGSNVSYLRESASATIEAARDKLRLLGLTDRQLEELEKRGTAEDHVTVYAPSDGVVTSKFANVGDYVRTGDLIYAIADLSHLWVKLDAYESDLAWLRYGQDVAFTATAFPGRVFEGRVSFIDPVLDTRTRTVKVRVNVENAEGLLKPGIFVRATIEAELTADGHVTTTDLRGKWIGPMHPEIIRDGPGDCEVCGMPLVRAEELGYETRPGSTELPLLIPASAPLITGRRAIVYIRDPDPDRPRFHGREVVLGPRAGDSYVVSSGVKEGELVVIHGAFKIDSAMQIQARPSMMSPEGGTSPGSHDHGAASGPAVMYGESRRFGSPPEFTHGFSAVYSAYRDLVGALSADDPVAARDAAARLAGGVGNVETTGLDPEARRLWSESSDRLQTLASKMSGAPDIGGIRDALPAVTADMALLLSSFDPGQDISVLRFHCPMAFEGRGADWLQSEPETANPYYGAAMYRCGEAIERIAGGQRR